MTSPVTTAMADAPRAMSCTATTILQYILGPILFTGIQV